MTMDNFVRQILIEARYSKYIDDSTRDIIDTLLRDVEYEPESSEEDDEQLTPKTNCVCDEEINNQELNNLVKHRKRYVEVDVSKEFFSVLKEAVKYPGIRKQFVLVDLGYGKAKVTTECLYKAIKDEILNKGLIVNKDGNGFCVRLKKKLLQDKEEY